MSFLLSPDKPAPKSFDATEEEDDFGDFGAAQVPEVKPAAAAPLPIPIPVQDNNNDDFGDFGAASTPAHVPAPVPTPAPAAPPSPPVQDDDDDDDEFGDFEEVKQEAKVVEGESAKKEEPDPFSFLGSPSPAHTPALAQTVSNGGAPVTGSVVVDTAFLKSCSVQKLTAPLLKLELYAEAAKCANSEKVQNEIDGLNKKKTEAALDDR
jgi:hypothetical protein